MQINVTVLNLLQAKVPTSPLLVLSFSANPNCGKPIVLFSSPSAALMIHCPNSSLLHLQPLSLKIIICNISQYFFITLAVHTNAAAAVHPHVHIGSKMNSQVHIES